MTPRLGELDAPYAAREFLGIGAPGETSYVPGAGVLFCAPHAVRQTRGTIGRDLRLKGADRYTGALAEALAEATGAGALTLVGAAGDAARDDPHPFKSRLAWVLGRESYKAVVDLHGMNNSHGVDLAIGLGSFPTPGTLELAAEIAKAADDYGLYWAVNPDGLQAGTLTLTTYVQREAPEVTVVQVELARDVRNPGSERTERALRALASLTPAGELAG